MVVECPLVVVLPVCLIQDIFNLDEYYLQDNPVCLPHLIRPQILVRCIATSSTFQLHQQAASVICLHRVCHRQTVQDYYSILPGKMYIFFVCPKQHQPLLTMLTSLRDTSFIRDIFLIRRHKYRQNKSYNSPFGTSNGTLYLMFPLQQIVLK